MILSFDLQSFRSQEVFVFAGWLSSVCEFFGAQEDVMINKAKIITSAMLLFFFNIISSLLYAAFQIYDQKSENLHRFCKD